MSLKTNRPKQYQPVNDISKTCESLREGSVIRLNTIDTNVLCVFVKCENDVLEYMILKQIEKKKIKKVAVHRIKRIVKI